MFDRIETIAKTHGVSMAQVGIAWSLSKPFVTAPIVGTTSLDKLRDLVGAFCFTTFASYKKLLMSADYLQAAFI